MTNGSSGNREAADNSRESHSRGASLLFSLSLVEIPRLSHARPREFRRRFFPLQMRSVRKRAPQATRIPLVDPDATKKYKQKEGETQPRQQKKRQSENRRTR